jgi:hypothetical protein
VGRVLVAALGGVQGDPGGVLLGEADAGALAGRVHLEGEGLGGGEQLHQEREPRAERLEDVLSEDRLGVVGDDLVEALAGLDQRRVGRVRTEPHLGAGNRQTAELGDVCGRSQA